MHTSQAKCSSSGYRIGKFLEGSAGRRAPRLAKTEPSGTRRGARASFAAGTLFSPRKPTSCATMPHVCAMHFACGKPIRLVVA